MNTHTPTHRRSDKPSTQSTQLRNRIKLGSTIKDYTLGKLLGRGSFGFVYAARSRHTNDDVAIKMVDKKLINSADLVSRVISEIEIHSQLDHPSILHLYTYFEDQQYVYVVIELCREGDMWQLVNMRKKLSETATKRVFVQLVHGLQYLHAHGVIHRDLKLSNVLISRINGDDIEVKLSDFGLAARLNKVDEDRGTICGTLNYMAPEVSTNRPHNAPADIWSLGCMLVTMLTGNPPTVEVGSEGEGEGEGGGDKGQNLRVFIPLLNTLSHTAKDLILSLLQPNPAKRSTLSNVLTHAFLHVDGKEKEKAKVSRESSTSITRPLSTKRIKPHTHRIRGGGIVCITEEQRVYIDIPMDKYCLDIDGDGQIVTLFDRKGKGGNGNVNSVCESYTWDNLPVFLRSRYRYAARFCDVLRSKTPRIVCYIEGVEGDGEGYSKCVYMENGDYELSLHNGYSATLTAESGVVCVKVPLPQSYSHGSILSESRTERTYRVYRTSVNDARVSTCLLPTLAVLKKCVEYCVHVEKEVEKESVGVSGYPLSIVIDLSEGEGGGGEYKYRYGSLSTYAHSHRAPSTISLNTTMTHTHTHTQPHIHQRRQSSILGAGVQSHSHSHSLSVVYSKELGWALRCDRDGESESDGEFIGLGVDGKICLLAHDGSTLWTLDAEENVVRNISPSNMERHPLTLPARSNDEHSSVHILPSHARSQLRNLGQLVSMFIQ